jgi:hypothetical protein
MLEGDRSQGQLHRLARSCRSPETEHPPKPKNHTFLHSKLEHQKGLILPGRAHARWLHPDARRGSWKMGCSYLLADPHEQGIGIIETRGVS